MISRAQVDADKSADADLSGTQKDGIVLSAECIVETCRYVRIRVGSESAGRRR